MADENDVRSVEERLGSAVRAMPEGWSLHHAANHWEVWRHGDLLGGLVGTSEKIGDALTPDGSLWQAITRTQGATG